MGNLIVEIMKEDNDDELREIMDSIINKIHIEGPNDTSSMEALSLVKYFTIFNFFQNTIIMNYFRSMNKE